MPMRRQPVDPTDLKMLIDYFHKSLVTAITSPWRRW